MDPSDGVESESLPPVKNLRSKFEQLAVDSAPRRPRTLVPPQSPGTPRPRATSNTYNSDVQAEVKHLRSASSSSDLKGTKRPPPPPPSRGLNGSSSPLLRPVPIPAASTPNLSLNNDPESATPSVASLRSKFANATIFTPSHSPRPSISESKPILSRSPTPLNAEDIDHSQSSSSCSSDPFSNDESVDSSTPPAIPARRHKQASDSSRTSSEGDIPLAPKPPPPRPPPRQQITVAPETNTVTTVLSPPPLPIRRSPIDELTVNLPTPIAIKVPPPRLPVRPSALIVEPTTPIERKPLGFSKLPPPPTRTIALGDKLPLARRPQTPSSEDDSAEEDEPQKGQFAADLLPDTSRSSRRAPIVSGYTTSKITVPAHTGHAICAGATVIVGTGHHIRVYDLKLSERPVYDIDTRSLGLGGKDIKVACLGFRPGKDGRVVWVGTKEGHLLEIDIQVGSLTWMKLSAHSNPVVYIFRYGAAILSIDEGGKVLIFGVPVSEDTMSLSQTVPRVARITEKLDFAKLIGGMLWTASRADCQGAGTPSRTPIIRVYDIFNPANASRSVLPTEHVGPVTSAAIIPSDPGHAYVGHEEGFITIWELQTEDGFPRCVEVVRVAVSDVLSLEGVNDRLWAGSRNGMISAYDVRPRPWVVTNCWNAHPGLPVLKLAVDHYGVRTTGRLCVLSVGRDEQLRLWDGLLSLDWVDKELLKHENSFSTFRDLRLLIVSWNADSARPDSLTIDAANINFLHDVLTSVDSPDIISFGFQEVIDLESRKMAAKNVFLGTKKKGDDGGLAGLSDKVTRAYKRWYDALLLAVRLAMPTDCPYSVIHTESLVGLFTCIFVKNSERVAVKDLSITSVKRGMGGRYGNKGGIISRFVIEDSSMCFINCHLAAGQNGVRARNADVAGMLEEKALFPISQENLAYVGGGDGTMVLDHELVFVNGDMNYRIDQRREPIIAAIRADDYECLYTHDQLLKEIKYNRGFRFRGFSEGPLSFPPTYKYDRRSDEFDTSEKSRSPAWCDRVLWRSRIPSRVHQLHYRRYEANVSDHRPISSAFKVTVKSVRHEVRATVKAEVEMLWMDEQEKLMAAIRQFQDAHLLV